MIILSYEFNGSPTLELLKYSQVFLGRNLDSLELDDLSRIHVPTTQEFGLQKRMRRHKDKRIKSEVKNVWKQGD